MKYLYLLFTFLVISVGFSQDTIEDFEGTTTLTAWEGLASASIVDDPQTMGTRGKVAKAVSSATGQLWQGFSWANTERLDLTNDKTLTFDAFSMDAVSFVVKVQGGESGAANSAVVASHNGSGWQTITLDYSSGNVDGTGPANGIYTEIAIHVNWDASTSAWGTPDERVLYFDNFKGVIPAAATTTDVTFTVNTANITVGANGMYLGGGIFNTANAHAMTDSGNGIWTVTVAIAVGTTGNYIFCNSPNDANDWGTKEDLAGQACADGQWNDRYLDAVGTDPYTLQHCFGSCETDGTCSTPVDPLLEWSATFEGNDFTAKEGLTYSEANGLGTITNINGDTPGSSTDSNGDSTLYAHIWATPEGGFDFSTADRAVTIQVKGPRSVPVKVKFEANNVEVDQTYDNVGDWQTLTFDFSSATPETRSKAIIFFDIESAASADLADDLFYIQQFTFGEAPQEPGDTSLSMDFEDASDAGLWTPSNPVIQPTHVTTGGNPDGALKFGYNGGLGANRLNHTNDNFDFSGAATARISFDILQHSATLVGTALHLRHSISATVDGQTSTEFDLQARGINPTDWTSFEFEEAVSPASSLVYIDFEVAQGTDASMEGTFLLDNVLLTLLDENGATLSTYEIETPQFITYPNPLQSTLNVKGTMEVENVSIYDLMGRNVLNAAPNKTEFSLDVSHLNKGVYMVQLKAGDKETTLKVIK